MKLETLQDINIISNKLINLPSREGDFTHLLKHIAEVALEAFAADACVVRAYNPLTGKLLEAPTLVGNLDTEFKWSYGEPRPRGVTQEALKEGLVLIEDLDEQPKYHSRFTRQGGFRALAALTMFTLHRQKLLGVIYLDYLQPHVFSAAERESLHIFSLQASFLLQETWSSYYYDQTARLGQEVNQRLSTIEELFATLQTYVDSVLDHDHTLLLAVNQPQSHTLDLYIREQERSLCLNAPHQGVCLHVIENQETLLIQHASAEYTTLPCQIVPVEQTLKRESYVFVPLVLRDTVLGVLSIQHGQPNVYGQEDLLIFQLLANYLALALHNMRLYTSLNQLNETGQLLTRQLESEDTIQATVEKIHRATQADVVVLYPYDSLHQRFILPPRIAGQLLGPTPYSFYSSRPDDMAVLMLEHPGPIFAKEREQIYDELVSEVLTRQGNFQERERVCSIAAIPLQVGEERVGVLFVNFRQAQRFDSTQKLFIEGLALYASIAIKNALVFGSLSERRMRELEILQQIDRELNRNLDLDSVLDTLMNLAAEHVGADAASILLYNSHIQALERVGAIGENADERVKHIFSFNDTRSISRWVLEHKKPVRVEDVLNDPQWRDIYVRTNRDTLSELDIPLLDGEEVLGVLNMESKKRAAFSQQDERFLLTLAGQALLAIRNAQAYEREKRLAEERRVLNEISKEIIGQLDYAHVFDLILEKALDLTRSTLGSLYLYEPELQTLRMVAGRGVPAEQIGQRQTSQEGIVGQVVRTQTECNVGDVSLPPWNETYRELFPGARSELAVPMLAGGKVRGVLNIESPRLEKFDERNVHLMQGLADLAVVALQSAERYEEARQDALRFDLLYQAGQQLGRITDLEQIEEAYSVISLIAWRKCQSVLVIRRFDAETQKIALVHASQPEEAMLHELMELDVLHRQVAQKRRTLIIHDVHHPLGGMTIPLLANTATRSLLIAPITFHERYYGDLELGNREISHFKGGDKHFFEGLAQQLANTIHRLEAANARQESEERMRDTEAMTNIGHMAFELTHRWDNDLGLVRSYVNDIQAEMDKLHFSNELIARKLGNIVEVTSNVLDLSKDLKREFVQSGEQITAEALLAHTHNEAARPQNYSPRELFEAALRTILLPQPIGVAIEIEQERGMVKALHHQVTDILRNLISNAIDAMPDGGQITLQACSSSSFMALNVIDQGGGIPEQSQHKIFDLFYSTKRSSGFGLWSARRNALKNHGELTVRSVAGQGATFTLLLPRGEGPLSEITE